MDLPFELASVRRARRFVEEHWCPCHGGAERAHVHLLTTELVCNAVRHGHPPITVGVECTGDGEVMVSVSDGGEDLPVRRDVGPEELGGRGVQLVDLLSSRWGVQPNSPTGHAGRHPGGDDAVGEAAARPGKGKTVWCRLAA